jgi:predicted dehydrogenase
MASVMKTHDLDDSVVLTLKMKSGALGSLNFHRFSRAFLSPCTLLGTQATLCFSAFITNPYQSAPVSLFLEQSPANLPEEIRDYHWPEDWWSAGKPGWINLWPPRNNAFREEHAAFAAAIRNHTAPAISGEDGYKALEIVLAAYVSLQERRPVRLPLDPQADIQTPIFR